MILPEIYWEGVIVLNDEPELSDILLLKTKKNNKKDNQELKLEACDINCKSWFGQD